MQRIFFPSSKPIFVNEKEVIENLRSISGFLKKREKKVRSIYLFGSYAKGKAGFRSDADILVVLSKDDRRMKDRLDEFILEFSDALVPVDVLVYTEEEIKREIGKGNKFLHDAINGIRLV